MGVKFRWDYVLIYYENYIYMYIRICMQTQNYVYGPLNLPK